ncbi:hypothetical protein Tco_1253183 [Tanacetum coccineum]
MTTEVSETCTGECLRRDFRQRSGGISGTANALLNPGFHGILNSRNLRDVSSIGSGRSDEGSLLKEHNGRGNVSPIRLSFDDTEDQPRVQTVVTGTVVNADLKKPFKEEVKTPLTRRIIEFAGPEFKMPADIMLYDGATDPEDHISRFSSAENSGEWPMPVWCRMFQQTLDGSARGWFENLPPGSIDGWAELRLQWIVETSFIGGVLEVMKISSFMDAHKCPELAKRFSDKVPKTVDEMMTRLDDFVSIEGKLNTDQRPLTKGDGEIGNAKGRDAGKDKIINMIRSWPDDKKRKSIERDKSWMKVPISFPPLSVEDVSDEPLIIEAVMEGYLVRIVYIDQGPH